MNGPFFRNLPEFKLTQIQEISSDFAQNLTQKLVQLVNDEWATFP